MQRRTLRFGNLQSLKQSRYRSGNRIWLQWRAVWIRENQIEFAAIIRAELSPEFILLLPMRLEHGDCGRR